MEEIDARSSLAHPFQTEPYAMLFNTDRTRSPYIVVAEDAKGLAAHWWGYFSRYREGLVPRSNAWARSGPVVREDLRDRRDEFFGPMLATLKRHVRQQRVGWIIFTSEALYGADCGEACRTQGFERHGLQTYLLDLMPSEEEMSKSLDQRARWSANKARKNGVSVGDAAADDDVRAYYRIYLETASFPGSNPPPEDVFLRGFNRLRDEKKARLVVAKHDGEVVAGSFFPCHAGFAAQNQHAVSAEARRLNAGSLLIWESMLSFKEAGFHTLDLVSVDVDPPEGSREAGVREFKSRFGGVLIDTPVYVYRSPALRAWRQLMGRLRSRR